MPRRDKNKKELIKDIEEIPPKKVKAPIKTKNLISTGSTLLNLSLSDNPLGAYKLGSIANFIGDSSAGKTFIMQTLLAMCSHDKRFKNHKLILDDAEERNDFDIGYIYGEETAKRIKAPKYDEDGLGLHSDKIEDWEANLHNLLDSEQPFIYVLDSLDSLDCEAEAQLTKDNLKKREKGQKEGGSYAMSKAKDMGKILRQIRRKIKKTNSLLIIISQTRANIGLGFAPKTRSGGEALRFYCVHESWIAKRNEIKKTIDGRERAIGIRSKIKTTKNSLIGKKRECDIEIYYDYGVDDIKCNIEYLVDEKYWKKKGTKIQAEEFGTEVPLKKLIKYIEDNNLEKELAKIVGVLWNKIEDSFKLDHRKRRF